MNDFDQLFEQISPAIYRIGYLKAITDNPEVEAKWDDSESGFALLTANLSVIECLFHFNYRCWIGSKDLVTIPTTYRDLKSPSDSDLAVKIETIQKPKELAAVQLIRVEHYAHLVEGRSRFRRSRDETGFPEPYITVDDLISLSLSTVRTLDELQTLAGRPRENIEFQLETSERQCRLFWNVLPQLKHGEVQQ